MSNIAMVWAIDMLKNNHAIVLFEENDMKGNAIKFLDELYELCKEKGLIIRLESSWYDDDEKDFAYNIWPK